MKIIAGFVKRAIEVRGDEQQLGTLRDEVKDLSSKFPLYSHRLVGGT